MNLQQSSRLGKYRDLVIAIGLFLVLDLGVLIFNFYSSERLEQNAVQINTAGELRMLTQQITKALLTMRSEQQSDLPIQTSMAQLTSGHSKFNEAFNQLKTVGEKPSSDALLAVFAEKMDIELIDDLEKEWRPLDSAIIPVVAAQQNPDVASIDYATTKAISRNIKLMQHADDLAENVEATARANAGRMRQIQVAGIVLALLNFIFIVFKFVRRLRQSDRLADDARKETDDILATVKEGLLLVRRDGVVGGQHSKSLEALFGRPIKPGQDFRALLAEMTPAGSSDAINDFLDLLFNEKVKPVLIEQLNPLQKVKIQRQNSQGESMPAYLTFEFAQIKNSEGVEELLVTVFDVSDQVLLEQELDTTKQRANSDIEDVLSVIEQSPAVVDSFLQSAEEKLVTANTGLQNVKLDSASYQKLAGEIFALVHGVKGEAAMFNIKSIQYQAHQFEGVLSELRRRPTLAGDDFIAVAVEISRLREQLDHVRRMVSKLRDFSRFESAEAEQGATLQQIIAQMDDLTKRIAVDLNKSVRFEAKLSALSAFTKIPEPVAIALKEAIPQLIRNAVAHGIEGQTERLRLGKSAEGLLCLEITKSATGQILVSVRDDGRGISVVQIRERLVSSGKRSAEQVSAMSDQAVVGMIFESGFSTTNEVNVHAGQGVGLALVRDIVNRLGVKLKISSVPNGYTQFTMQF